VAEPREFKLELPPGMRLLSLNGRQHWAQRNRATQVIKQAAWAVAKQARVPRLERAEITVIYRPPDRRRRDAGNLAASGKAAIDGLVLAGVLADDDSSHLIREEYEIGDLCPLRRGRLVIRIREAGAPR
jgi:Holliday junction resolvase RusA-like endonuclease